MKTPNTFRPVIRMCPARIFGMHTECSHSGFLECTSIIKEYTTNFHPDGILAHSGTSVTRLLESLVPEWKHQIECRSKLCWQNNNSTRGWAVDINIKHKYHLAHSRYLLCIICYVNMANRQIFLLLTSNGTITAFVLKMVLKTCLQMRRSIVHYFKNIINVR